MTLSPYRAPETILDDAYMHPSPYRLPQRVPPDVQRGRRAFLAHQQLRYELQDDVCPGHPEAGFTLPPFLKNLPPASRFTAPKLGRFMAHKMVAKLNFRAVDLLGPRRFETFDDFARLYRLIPPPAAVVASWRTDAAFAWQRIAGVNPMSLTRCAHGPSPEVVRALEPVLAERRTTLTEALDAGRLYETSYAVLDDPRIQARVREKATVLAAPTCWFYLDRAEGLVPAGIQLRPPGAAVNPVFTPRSAPLDWLAARMHAQAADAHAHEGVFHLLETHLVTEAIAVCAARHLHPAHPIAQLFEKHFESNLAINELARRDILGPDGPIERAMAAGVSGALDAARAAYASWDFFARSAPVDIARRGLDDKNLWPTHPWRDGAMALWDAIDTYVRMLLRPWYTSDHEVLGDWELQAWVAEASSARGGRIPGFPSKVASFEELVAVVREVLYRASAGHAAVNNGQFDAYGFVPNAPGAFCLPLPVTDAPGYTEAALVAALGDRRRAAAQMAMTWVLSEPTQHSLMRAGESPAFAREHCWEAHDAVIAFRLRLQAIEDECQRRQAREPAPYRYLNPWNVSRSIET